MRRMTLILASALVMLSSLACRLSLPRLSEIRLPSFGPRLEVGPMQEFDHEVQREGTTEARVKVGLGVGEITLAAGDPDPLFAGHFRTNVAAWAPEMTWQNGVLWIEQGESRGIPDPGAENEWDLRFSPEVEIAMEMEMGVCDGDLDFTGLSLTRLSLETGASDLVIRFDAPNPARMDDLTIKAGAASLRVDGIGNAGPGWVTVEGGVGNTILDFSGAWPRSARVDITAGVGSLILRVPENVGVRVEIEGGLGDVQADAGLTRSDGAYVNSAHGEAETELLITITVGLGSVELVSVGE